VRFRPVEMTESLDVHLNAEELEEYTTRWAKLCTLDLETTLIPGLRPTAVAKSTRAELVDQVDAICVEVHHELSRLNLLNVFKYNKLEKLYYTWSDLFYWLIRTPKP
jgi:hypothetical protein